MFFSAGPDGPLRCAFNHSQREREIHQPANQTHKPHKTIFCDNYVNSMCDAFHGSFQVAVIMIDGDHGTITARKLEERVQKMPHTISKSKQNHDILRCFSSLRVVEMRPILELVCLGN